VSEKSQSRRPITKGLMAFSTHYVALTVMCSCRCEVLGYSLTPRALRHISSHSIGHMRATGPVCGQGVETAVGQRARAIDATFRSGSRRTTDRWQAIGLHRSQCYRPRLYLYVPRCTQQATMGEGGRNGRNRTRAQPLTPRTALVSCSSRPSFPAKRFPAPTGNTLPSRDSCARYREVVYKRCLSCAQFSLISSQPGAVAAGQARARSASSRTSHLLWGLGSGAEPILIRVTNAAPSTFM
jgi:hypothetical protein